MAGLAKHAKAVSAAFDRHRVFDLREMGNEMAEEAALTFDKDIAELSIVAYALHKLLSKEHFAESAKWRAECKVVSRTLAECAKAAAANDMQRFRRGIAHMAEQITALERRIGHYTQQTFEKARTKQASRAYAAGLSIMQAAELMGADAKLLQNYIGTTKIHDEVRATKGIRERLKPLKELLG